MMRIIVTSIILIFNRTLIKDWILVNTIYIILLSSLTSKIRINNNIYRISYLHEFRQIMSPPSSLLVLLRILILPRIIQSAVRAKIRKGYGQFLNIIILNTFILIRFSMSQIINFYFCFESTIFPTILIILIWGYQPERLKANIYLFIYILTCSMPLLNIIIWALYEGIGAFYSSSIISLKYYIKLSMIMAFLAKAPIFYLHLWLPKAHVEAPVEGSLYLAALLLKLGAYGLIILNENYKGLILNESMIKVWVWIGGGVTTIVCLRQTDIKILIAYSSISHIGIALASLMTNYPMGIKSSYLTLMAHGFIRPCIFIVAGVIYDQMKTRNFYIMSGKKRLSKIYSLLFFLVLCSNIGAPPTPNFIREIFIIIRILKLSWRTWISLPVLIIITIGYSRLIYFFIFSSHPTNNIKLFTQSSKNIRSVLFLLALNSSYRIWSFNIL